MEPTAADHEAVDREEHVVHAWRVSQLARLVQRGCPPRLALRIAR
jgi:hypothetical protein